MKQIQVAPSVLSANFSNISKAILEIEESGADLIHLDVMDGQFVTNLTFGPKFVADLRPLTKLPLDVHLMTITPHRLFQDFIDAGSDMITFHWEAEVHHHRWLEWLRDKGVKAGISLVPSTPVELLTPILPFVDNILVMTVNPGFGGQTFLSFCLDKIQKLAQWRKELGLNFVISVDGGIQTKTGLLCSHAGADILIAGSSFFGSNDRRAFVRDLKGV